ncbi:MAG: PD-(D/E)XK nuclease family protein [Methylophilaceae bacterium]
MFNHLDVELPKLERETIDGVRYYSIPKESQVLKLVSITSVTSHFNREIFINWRKKIGEEEAQKITKAATSRGTDMHSLVENYLYNKTLPSVPPLPDFLFKIAKAELNKINNIHCLEGALYSLQLGVAGTTDCIAEYDGELAVIDFKTSKKPKPREWIENYFVQAMFYGMAYYEMTGTPIKKLVIIMACENGESVVYEESDLKKYMKLVVQYIKKFVNDKLELMGVD